jgi:hypothetical protein
MNKRIQELAEQAGLLPREIGPVVETRHMKKKEQDLEKFAELIVRDCLSIARLQRNNMQFLASNPPQSAAAYDIERNIMNHFGVEE